MNTNSAQLISSRVNVHKRLDLLVLEDDEIELAYHGKSADLLDRMRNLLNGSHEVSEIAAAVDSTPAELLAVLKPLAEASFVLQLPKKCDLSPCEFLDIYRNHCAFYKREIFSQPFWRHMRSGTASRDVVLGWGIEMYHYVSAANEHMAVAVAQCRRNNSWRHWLAEHYVEEYDHDKVFLEGLVETGFTTTEIVASPPLPATRGLINFLYELASTDTFGYTATFGVMQSEPAETTQNGIESFFGQLTQYYPFASGIFSAFRNHALTDLALDHQKLVIERICGDSLELVGRDRIRTALDSVRDVAEHFIHFFENIAEYYSDVTAPIPRRALELRMLA